MVRRLLVGLVLGLVVGGMVGAGLVAGLGVTTFATMGGVIGAYLAAIVTGVLTGLVAGKPIWSSGAKIEAGLKAFFGALMGAGLMFALRQWAGSFVLDLPAIGAHGPTPINELPAASLPLLAAVLGGFFELDNTGDPEKDAKTPGASKGRQRVAAGSGAQAKARPIPGSQADGADADSDDEAEVGSRRAKR
jgi:hypothetical protein